MKRFSAFLISALFLSAMCGACRKEDGKIELKGLVLLTAGSVRTDKAELKTGDVISSGEVVRVGSGSVCDLQITGSSSTIIVRLRENAEFRVDGFRKNGVSNIVGRLGSGQAMVNALKLGGSESAAMQTPTAVASVRGTKFEVVVAGDGSTRTNVYEGSVSSRLRLARLEDLPPEVVEKTDLGKEVAVLEKSEQTLQAGQSISIERRDVDSHLNGNPELRAVLDRPEIRGLSAAAKPEEIQKAVAAVDSHFADPAHSQSFQKSLSTPPAGNVRAIPPDELKAKIKEYEELIAAQNAEASDEAERKSAVQERNAAQRELLEHRIESVLGRSSETLILRDGRRIKGVIVQEGSTYHVFAVDGHQIFSDSQVEGFAF